MVLEGRACCGKSLFDVDIEHVCGGIVALYLDFISMDLDFIGNLSFGADSCRYFKIFIQKTVVSMHGFVHRSGGVFLVV